MMIYSYIDQPVKVLRMATTEEGVRHAIVAGLGSELYLIEFQDPDMGFERMIVQSSDLSSSRGLDEVEKCGCGAVLRKVDPVGWHHVGGCKL